jgi:hypothetical protein
MFKVKGYTLYICPTRHPNNWTLDFGFDGLRQLLSGLPYTPICEMCGEVLQKVDDTKDVIMFCLPTVEADPPVVPLCLPTVEADPSVMGEI